MSQMSHNPLVHSPGHLRLRNKSCVIFGASTFVAATVARTFALEGCNLLLVDQDAEAIRELSHEIKEAAGFAVPCVVKEGNGRNLERALSLNPFRKLDLLIDDRTGAHREYLALDALLRGGENLIDCISDIRLLLASFTPVLSEKALPKELSGVDSNPVSAVLAKAIQAFPRRYRMNAICLRTKEKDLIGADVGTRPASDQSAPSRSLLAQYVAYAALFLASEEAAFVQDLCIPVGEA